MIYTPFDIRPNAEVLHNAECGKSTLSDRPSDELTALLALVLKDGFVDRTFISLLKDIYPFVGARDRAFIGRLFCAEKKAVRLKEVSPSPCSCRCELTHSRRISGLFSVLRKYGGKSASDTLTMAERAMAMSGAFSGKGTDPMSLLGMLMPQGGPGDISGLLKIMQSMNK